MKILLNALVAVSLTAGVAMADDSSPESFLVVKLAHTATISDGKLELVGGKDSVVVFSDRPYRDTETLTVAEVLENWSKGSDNLVTDPPNAALTGTSGGEEVGLIVELTEPVNENGTLVFTINQLAGPQVSSLDNVSLIIDDICIPHSSYCLMTGTMGDQGD